jgi:SnoaL-like protein
MRDLVIRSSDDVAYCHSLIHLTGKRTDGERTDVWYRETLCFRRTGDQWPITHVHESVPMHMDGTFKAAVDLKPSEEVGDVAARKAREKSHEHFLDQKVVTDFFLKQELLPVTKLFAGC